MWLYRSLCAHCKKFWISTEKKTHYIKLYVHLGGGMRSCSMGIKFQVSQMNVFQRLLYNIVSIVNNMILCTSKFVEYKSHFQCSYHQGEKGEKNRKKSKPKSCKETVGGTDMSMTLIVVVVSRVLAYVQTHQNVHIKCVQLFIHP